MVVLSLLYLFLRKLQLLETKGTLLLSQIIFLLIISMYQVFQLMENNNLLLLLVLLNYQEIPLLNSISLIHQVHINSFLWALVKFKNIFQINSKNQIFSSIFIFFFARDHDIQPFIF